MGLKDVATIDRFAPTHGAPGTDESGRRSGVARASGTGVGGEGGGDIPRLSKKTTQLEGRQRSKDEKHGHGV